MYHVIRSGYSLLAAVLALLMATAAPAQGISPATQVFSLETSRDDAEHLVLRFDISPGNYLYRDRISAAVDGNPLPLTLPAGDQKDDPNFGRVEVYHQGFQFRLTAVPDNGELSVRFQGCAEVGICYPPVVKTVDLANLAAVDMHRSQPERMPAFAEVDAAPQKADWAASAMAAGPFTMLLAFLGFGILLAFTPCVFPMIPILSGVLTRAGDRLTATRGFALSATYVLAIAAAYGLVGLVAGWSGANLQAALQTPWALGISAAVFVVLSLSMFGLYELQLPAGLASRFSPGRSGSLAGAAMLGFGSALIVGPCVTPPLAAAMLYAVQTGDALRGAGALFAMGLGMGLPLIAVGTFGVKILPKSGAWLATVRRAFGVVFLGIAVTLATRLMPGPAALALWGSFAIGVSVYLGAFDRLDGESGGVRRLSKAAGRLTALYGSVMVVGAAAGANDPFRPLAFGPPRGALLKSKPETRVTSITAFDEAVKSHVSSGSSVLISFSADWCTTCKSNERIMQEPDLAARLRNVPMIIADVTAQGTDQRTLMSRFAVIGPPVLFLMDANGREIPGSRIVGPITAEDIASRLQMAGT
jgi:thiol:disulfide interchange protein DsbD